MGVSDEQDEEGDGTTIIGRIYEEVRKIIINIISVGRIPKHIAFIMDGNRRYAKKKHLEEKDGYRLGFYALVSLIKYCYEFGIRHVSIYAFSIDNFRRKRDDVEFLMELMQEKLEGLLHKHSLAHNYGVRVTFLGNLNLLTDGLKEAARKVTEVTAHNDKIVLQICVAYTTTDEIVHAVDKSCRDRWRFEQENNTTHNRRAGRSIEVIEIEKQMYMSEAPEPDILVRTAGETRLSNYILWHTPSCLLYSPNALWPEFGFWHLVWTILNFQYHLKYLKRKRKMSHRIELKDS